MLACFCVKFSIVVLLFWQTRQFVGDFTALIKNRVEKYLSKSPQAPFVKRRVLRSCRTCIFRTWTPWAHKLEFLFEMNWAEAVVKNYWYILSRNRQEVLWLASSLWGFSTDEWAKSQQAAVCDWQVINPRVKSHSGVSPKYDWLLWQEHHWFFFPILYHAEMLLSVCWIIRHLLHGSSVGFETLALF